jgi:hypothetical protein
VASPADTHGKLLEMHDTGHSAPTESILRRSAQVRIRAKITYKIISTNKIHQKFS